MNKFNYIWRNLAENRWYVMLTGFGIGLILFYIICELIQLNLTSRNDFRIFYQAAQALKWGNDPYITSIGWYPYPPFLAYILIPLTHFSEKNACLIHESLNVCLLICNFILGFRVLASAFQLKFNRWQALGACSLALLFCYHEVWWEFRWGQVDLYCLVGVALGLFWINSKPYRAGICIGITAIIKYQSVIFLPFLLFRARWRMVIGMTLGIVAGALLPALSVGWHRNLEYLAVALKGIVNMPGGHHQAGEQIARIPAMIWSGNISITSGLARIFLDHGWPQSHALILVSAIAIAMFGLLWKIFQRQKIPFIFRTPQTLGNAQKEKGIIILEWSAILLGMLIFSPQCNMRHLILLLNVHLLAAVLLLFPRHNVKRWPVLTAVLIFQFGKLFDDLIAHPLHLEWSYFGGPCWTLLIFLPLIISNGLAYCCDIYGSDVMPARIETELDTCPIKV